MMHIFRDGDRKPVERKKLNENFAQTLAVTSAGLQSGGAALTPSQAKLTRVGLGLSKLASTIVASRIHSPDASPINAGVTITAGLNVSALANSLPLSTSTSRFLYGGGAYVSNGQPADLPLKSSSVASGNIGVAGALSVTNFIEFYTTAAAVRLRVYVGGGDAQYAALRVRLDGRYVSRNSVRILTLASQPAGTVCAVNLDFSSHGGAGIRRRVRIEADNGVNLSTLSYDTGDLWAPANDAPRVCFFTDSYGVSGAGFAAGVNMMDNVAHRMAAKLGWNATCSGVGGTGFVNNGGVNYAFNHPTRLADMDLQPFDGIVIAGGTNDGNGTAAQITASALTVLQKARSVTAGEIIVMGCWNSQVASTLPMAQIETAIEAAVTAFGDAKTYFVPITNDPAGSWITAGNASLYIAADGTHAKPGIGEDYFAERGAAAVQSLLVA